jgi:hypothetical protein
VRQFGNLPRIEASYEATVELASTKPSINCGTKSGTPDLVLDLAISIRSSRVKSDQPSRAEARVGNLEQHDRQTQVRGGAAGRLSVSRAPRRPTWEVPPTVLRRPTVSHNVRLFKGWTGDRLSHVGLGCAKTKSDLVVMPSRRQIFPLFCPPHHHRAQNSGCDYTA